jgi:hypothetical protein
MEYFSHLIVQTCPRLLPLTSSRTLPLLLLLNVTGASHREGGRLRNVAAAAAAAAVAAVAVVSLEAAGFLNDSSIWYLLFACHAPSDCQAENIRHKQNLNQDSSQLLLVSQGQSCTVHATKKMLYATRCYTSCQ